MAGQLPAQGTFALSAATCAGPTIVGLTVVACIEDTELMQLRDALGQPFQLEAAEDEGGERTAGGAARADEAREAHARWAVTFAHRAPSNSRAACGTRTRGTSGVAGNGGGATAGRAMFLGDVFIGNSSGGVVGGGGLQHQARLATCHARGVAVAERVLQPREACPRQGLVEAAGLATRATLEDQQHLARRHGFGVAGSANRLGSGPVESDTSFES